MLGDQGRFNAFSIFPFHMLLSALCLICGVVACVQPWYFIAIEDYSVGSTTMLTWSWNQLMNETTLSHQTAVQYYDKNAPHVYISLLVSFVLVSVATGLVAISIISMALWFHGSVFFCEKAKSSRKSEHFPLPKNKGGFFWVLCVRMERKS
eukprot:TRINITY_DN863_c0_g1_i2.p1 TRINITY_DN863_c0_g1~~TRINITY_DN863_c0_g1_i2.p1  ORF type:complete len:151 (-),score=8.58 TRINITY_DN863_c0_g1_i2:745-1197(-)